MANQKPRRPCTSTLSEAFDQAEAAALRDQPVEFTKQMRGDPARLRVLRLCQEADRLAGTEGDDEEEALRMAIAREVEGAMTGRKGRPPHTEAMKAHRAKLAEFAETRKQASANAQAAIESWQRFIADAAEIAPDRDRLERRLIPAQHRLWPEILEHLEAVAGLLEKEQTLRATGQRIIGRLSRFVAFTTKPWLDVQAGDSHWLPRIIKQVRMKYDAEVARLNVDPIQQAAEARQKHIDGQYQSDLNPLAGKYRLSPKGRKAWKVYMVTLNAYESLRDAAAGLTLAEDAERGIEKARAAANEALQIFYTEACAFAGVEAKPHLFPKLK